MENKLKPLFESQNVNLLQMSKKTGISYSVLYDIASGKTELEKIKFGNVQKIAHEFGLSLDELVGEDLSASDRYAICQAFDKLDSYHRGLLLEIAETFVDRSEGLRNQYIYEAIAGDFS